MSTCSMPDCNGRVLARSYCKLHYDRWYRTGDPSRLTLTPRGSALSWLQAKASFAGDECLLWPFKSKYANGYGSVTFNGHLTGAHRVMCRFAHGKPPTRNHHAAHSCGNRICVNPKHLAWKTASENEQDKLLHGTAQRGEQNPCAKLTEADVLTIRALARSRTHASIAKQFGVSRRAIGFVITRHTWWWVQ